MTNTTTCTRCGQSTVFSTTNLCSDCNMDDLLESEGSTEDRIARRARREFGRNATIVAQEGNQATVGIWDRKSTTYTKLATWAI